MGVILPITLFFLLGLHTFSQFFTIAASTFLTWGVADLFSNLVERPRLKGRSPAAAIREDVERRAE
jgi:peptidoglycan/LPS O-acetylase OafA/YrhL